MIAKLNDMMPGDMPDADPFFIMAYKELTNPAYGLGTKHIIFISDGDHWGAQSAAARQGQGRQDHLHDRVHHHARPGRDPEDGRWSPS